MKKKSIIFAWLLVLSLLLTSSMTALADNTPNANNSELNAYEYGSEPADILVFVYRGYAPFLEHDINTSGCIEGRLYVYSQSYLRRPRKELKNEGSIFAYQFRVS